MDVIQAGGGGGGGGGEWVSTDMNKQHQKKTDGGHAQHQAEPLALPHEVDLSMRR